ncbi:MAG: VOC family protein [Geminicoccaceae bacterium]
MGQLLRGSDPRQPSPLPRLVPRLGPSGLGLQSANPCRSARTQIDSCRDRPRPFPTTPKSAVRLLSTSHEETHGNVYNRLFHGHDLILQLHGWDEEGHPNLVDRFKGPPGHGVLLWFQVSDFDDAVGRARALGAEIVQEPAVNPESGDREIWLRDPDGYTVVLSHPQ